MTENSGGNKPAASRKAVLATLPANLPALGTGQRSRPRHCSTARLKRPPERRSNAPRKATTSPCACALTGSCHLEKSGPCG